MWPSGTSLPFLPTWASLAVAETAGIGCAAPRRSWSAGAAGGGGGAWLTITGACWECRARRTDSSPSLISSSARLDLSSRSMSALILRRSMQASSDLYEEGGGLFVVGIGADAARGRRKAGELANSVFKGVTVAVGAATADNCLGQVAEVGAVPEGFSCVRVGHVDLDEGNPAGGQRIAQRHRGVGECRRIDQHEVGAIGHGRLDPIDELVLGVGLEGFQGVAAVFGTLDQAGVDFRQGDAPIDIGLAHAEQIEIGSMQDKDFGHRSLQSG